MRFEKFDPLKHNLIDVATLIYDVDFWTFDRFYKNKESAIKDIKRSIEKEETNKGFQVILDDESEIMGIVMMDFHKRPSIIHSLKTFTSFKLFAIDILDALVLCDVKKDDLYIAELAISSKYRGQGLGGKVLDLIIENASSHGFKRVILDADFRNLGAKKLYEKKGFKEYNKKSVKIGKHERGMYNMEYALK